jgi:hypothetical protein
VTLTNGTASITLTGLGGNTKHTVIATYNGGPVYASGSSTAYTFVVQPATIAVTQSFFTDATTPPSSAPGNPVGFSLILTPSVYVSGGLTGTVNFYNGNTLVGSGMIQQTAQANGTVVYTAGFTTSTLAPSCLAGQTLPNCSNVYHIYASFAGNGNYAGFTTNAVAIIVTVPTYSVTASSTTITSTASLPGTAALAVTSYSTFQGGVALSCSGLPANAYCVFRPGLISLTYVPVFPATVPATSNIPVQNTTMEILVSEDPVTIKSLSSFGLLGLFASLGLFLVGFRRKGTRGAVAFCVVGMLGGMMLGSLSGCGASSSSSAYPTPPGTYAITLMATATPLGSGGQPPSVLDITKVSSAGTTVTLDASTTTGYTVGELVSVAGVSNAAYDGNFNLTSVKTITVQPVGGVGQPTYYDEITYSLPTAMTGTGTGGTVRPGNLTFTYPFTLVVK